jgi:hypothetical protein
MCSYSSIPVKMNSKERVVWYHKCYVTKPLSYSDFLVNMCSCNFVYQWTKNAKVSKYHGPRTSKHQASYLLIQHVHCDLPLNLNDSFQTNIRKSLLIALVTDARLKCEHWIGRPFIFHMLHEGIL